MNFDLLQAQMQGRCNLIKAFKQHVFLPILWVINGFNRRLLKYSFTKIYSNKNISTHHQMERSFLLNTAYLRHGTIWYDFLYFRCSFEESFHFSCSNKKNLLIEMIVFSFLINKAYLVRLNEGRQMLAHHLEKWLNVIKLSLNWIEVMENVFDIYWSWLIYLVRQLIIAEAKSHGCLFFKNNSLTGLANLLLLILLHLCRFNNISGFVRKF